MSTLQAERRSSALVQMTGIESTAEIVKKGLLIQRRTGTVSAIEYLKAHIISPAIIQRILSGSQIRSEDKIGLDQN